MGNVKTLEEFAINEIQNLRKENQDLKQELENYKAIGKAQEENRKFWENSYYTLIEKIKKDFKIQIEGPNKKPYIHIENSYIWPSNTKEEYEYYKNLFNLKEEGEEENEQSNSN